VELERPLKLWVAGTTFSDLGSTATPCSTTATILPGQTCRPSETHSACLPGQDLGLAAYNTCHGKSVNIDNLAQMQNYFTDPGFTGSKILECLYCDLHIPSCYNCQYIPLLKLCISLKFDYVFVQLKLTETAH